MNTEAQFAQLLAAHRGILYKVSRAYAGRTGAADDLAQEIALALWRGFGSYDARLAKFSTWMYRVALNVAISFERKERLRRHEPLAGLLEVPRAPFLAPELEWVYEWIERLPRATDKALMLLYLDGESQREIATLLGMSETNVSTRLGRLKEALRKELAPR